jgi:hypothetical protein
MLFAKLNTKYEIPNTKFGGFVMTSDAQVAANRSNAAKSTGPRTAQGKAVVAQNALKHGLLARDAVIRGEDPGEFEFYRDRMLGELAPVGMTESVLAERAVGLSWRLRRAERVQNEVFDTLYSGQADSPLSKLTQSMLPKHLARPQVSEDGRDLTLGRVVVKDFANSRVLDRLLMYERRIEHSFYKTMAEIQKLRLMRELDEPVEKPAMKRRVEASRPEGSRLPRRCAARNDIRERSSNRAKQSQFPQAPASLNCLSEKGLREETPVPSAEKQSQFAGALSVSDGPADRRVDSGGDSD